MRAVLLTALLAATAACGGNKNPTTHDDAPIGSEPMGPDAPPVPRCARVNGTAIPVRRIAYGCGENGHPAPPLCNDDGVMLVTSPPNDGRLFAVLRSGEIRVLQDEMLKPEAFLDISDNNGGPVL